MRKKKILLTAALAAVLVAVVAVGSTLAYFTDHTEAKGSAEVALGYKTEILEEFGEMKKIVTIVNNEDSKERVWVRVKAYSAYPLNYVFGENTSWQTTADTEGFYVYDLPLAPGEPTEPLEISIVAPADETGTEEFNVVVTYECTKVFYDGNGDPVRPPEWHLEADVKKGGE